MRETSLVAFSSFRKEFKMGKLLKSLFKTEHAEVSLTNTSAETKKAIEKLSKEALGASAKVIRKKLRDSVPLRTKRFKNHIASWKFIDKATGKPTLHIGFYSWARAKKKGKLPSHSSPYWIEFGTQPHVIKAKNAKVMRYEVSYGVMVKHPGQAAQHILRDTIQNNIGEIRAAQEEYLKKISEILDAEDIQYNNSPDEEND